MRLLFIVLSLLLVVAYFGFVLTNLDAYVGVTVWKTHHEGVPLYLLVGLTLVTGILYIGIIAVAQGVQLWLVNRRLMREIQRLETELNYLRTQPLSPPASGETAEESEPPVVGAEPDETDDRGMTVPSAPVYGADDDSDPDDDIYSGGRAV